MDILKQLEEHVAALLTTQTSLTEENARLKKDLAAGAALREENRRLQKELETERAKNQEALSRVTSMLQRIKDRPE